jgi:hypothetical protein
VTGGFRPGNLIGSKNRSSHDTNLTPREQAHRTLCRREQCPRRQQQKEHWLALSANFVSGFASGAYSAKLFAGTKPSAHIVRALARQLQRDRTMDAAAIDACIETAVAKTLDKEIDRRAEWARVQQSAADFAARKMES